MIWKSEMNLMLIILLILCVVHKFIYGDLCVACVPRDKCIVTCGILYIVFTEDGIRIFRKVLLIRVIKSFE